MKILVESYFKNTKISDRPSSDKPKIKNEAVLSIIDNAIIRNNNMTNAVSANMYDSTASKYNEQ